MNLVALFEEALEFQNFNGTVLSNGKVRVFYIGRTSLADIYNDVAGEYPSENPKILDNLGMGPIYVNPAFDYEIVVYDEYDNELFSVKKYLHSSGAHSTSNVEVVPSENIQVSAWTQGDVQVYMPYITGNLGKVYSGIEPIVVNNDEDKISAQHVPLGLQEPLFFVEDSESACIIGCSAQSELPEGTMNESAFSYDASSNITAYNGSAFKAGDEFPESATEAINVVTANSATWNGPYVPLGSGNSAESYSLAQGLNNSAQYNSLAQGMRNKAMTASLAQGYANTAEDYSFAQGELNSAKDHSMTQGAHNSAIDNSIAMGEYNSARLDSMAQGSYNSALNNSQVFGDHLIATATGMAIGQYNLIKDAAFVIGYGTSTANRKDIFVIDHTGNVSAQGDISASGISLTSFYTNYKTNSANFITALPDDLVYTGDLNGYAKKDFVNDSIDSATSGLLPTSSFSSVSGNFLTALPSDLISSQSGTIFVSGYEIEGTNSAVATATVQGFTKLFSNETIGPNRTATFSWNETRPNTTFTFTTDYPSVNILVSYSANTNLTGEIIVPGFTATKLDVSIPDATVISIWSNDWVSITGNAASAADSIGMTVGELAWASALPTYQYDSSNKISAINGSALANYELPTSVSAATDSVTANSATWNSVTDKLETTAFSDVSGTFITALPQDLVYTADIADMATTSQVDEKLDSTAFSTVSGSFLTAVDLTPYQTTAGMTAYQSAGDYYSASNPSGFLVANDITGKLDASIYAADSGNFLTAIPTGTMNESAFEYDANDKISGYNGSAFAAGGDVPEGVMVESGLEYNAVQEISGYNGSAIAQYGAEKQWLQHDDTIVHVANSAQYAFGVNLSAVAQLLGVDETVLFETAAYNNNLSSIPLSEPITAFDRVRIYDVKNHIYEQSMFDNSLATFMLSHDTSGNYWRTFWNVNTATYTQITYNSGWLGNKVNGVPYSAGANPIPVGAPYGRFVHPWKIIGIGRKQ